MWSPIIEKPKPVRSYLLVAFSDTDLFLKARKDIVASYGAIEYESEIFSALSWKSAYTLEHRYLNLLCFEKLIKREELVSLRQRSITIETKYQKNNLPQIELDPGYVNLYSVVHSTLTEDFHTVYLYGGIYAENLYFFEKLAFRPFSHTQEYFSRKEILASFDDIRRIYEADIF